MNGLTPKVALSGARGACGASKLRLVERARRTYGIFSLPCKLLSTACPHEALVPVPSFTAGDTLIARPSVSPALDLSFGLLRCARHTNLFAREATRGRSEPLAQAGMFCAGAMVMMDGMFIGSRAAAWAANPGDASVFDTADIAAPGKAGPSPAARPVSNPATREGVPTDAWPPH